MSMKVLVYAKRSNTGFDSVCAIKIAHKHICQLYGKPFYYLLSKIDILYIISLI